jgi:hypothetical protein
MWIKESIVGTLDWDLNVERGFDLVWSDSRGFDGSAKLRGG